MSMAQRMDKNFRRRFKDRIVVVYLDKSLTPAERKVQDTKLYKAIRQVMAGILKREPTQEEIVGLKDISKHKFRRKD